MGLVFRFLLELVVGVLIHDPVMMAGRLKRVMRNILSISRSTSFI